MDVFAKLRPQPAEGVVVATLLDEEIEIFVAKFRLTGDLIGDDFVQLRRNVELHLVRRLPRGIDDARDLAAHLRGVIADDHRQESQRKQRNDDEEDRQDGRPGAFRADPPDASSFAIWFRRHRAESQQYACLRYVRREYFVTDGSK